MVGRCCGGPVLWWAGAAAAASHGAAACDSDVAVATVGVHGFAVWDRVVVAGDVGSTRAVRVCVLRYAGARPSRSLDGPGSRVPAGGGWVAKRGGMRARVPGPARPSVPGGVPEILAAKAL
ncbi:hypothetical protein Ait01nite_080100 [Actinoplanes italicus]|nr:hypothetical protein Ait01nite_080100 [Actinoplanes italicus]